MKAVEMKATWVGLNASFVRAACFRKLHVAPYTFYNSTSNATTPTPSNSIPTKHSWVDAFEQKLLRMALCEGGRTTELLSPN